MKKCDCYYEEERVYYDHMMFESCTEIHGFCNGTRERDECLCGGDRTKCDFYPEVIEKALKELEPKFGEWISVEDRLPEKDVDVLCYSNKNGGYFFVGYRGAHSGEWCKDGIMHVAKVLYWTPISNPSKGEQI